MGMEHPENPIELSKRSSSEEICDSTSTKPARRADVETTSSLSPGLDGERPALRGTKRRREQVETIFAVEIKPEPQEAVNLLQARTVERSSSLVQAEEEQQQQHKKQKLSCEKGAEAVQMDSEKEEAEQEGSDVAQQEESSEGKTDSGEAGSEVHEEEPESEDEEVDAQHSQQARVALYHELVADILQMMADERRSEMWQRPKRELEMRFRKYILGLPTDHCWVREDWLEFEKLDKLKVVEEFQLDLEQVMFLFPTEEEYQELQEAPPVPDSVLQTFIMSLNQDPTTWSADIYDNMFQQLWRAGRIQLSARSLHPHQEEQRMG